MKYITFLDLKNKNLIGIFNKIEYQVQAFEKLGLEVERINFWKNSNFIDKVMKRLICNYPFNYYEEIKLNAGEVILIRYPFCDKNLIRFFKYIKEKYNGKIIMEIPSFPYERELSPWMLRKDIAFRDELKKYVDYILSFSKDEEIYGIKSINIYNGIDVNNYKKTERREIDNIIYLLSVSSVTPWHGLDRVLKGIKEYNDSHGNKVYFRVVGQGPELRYIKKLATKLDINRWVEFLGIKYGEELDRIYSESDVAISSASLNKYGYTYTSALKNREYAARGIPFVIFLQDYGFCKEFNCVLEMQEDDGPVNIEKIVNFINDLKADREDYTKKMRKYAEDNLTWEKIYKSALFKIGLIK